MSKTPLRDFKNLCRELREDDWRTPDTYCKDFAAIKDVPAVYMFLLVDNCAFDKALVAYVGMSTRLNQRLIGHPVLAEIETPGYWSMRWFKPTPARSLRAVESSYITKFDPPWNIMGRPRGVVLQ